MKFCIYIYISILAFCLSVSLPAFATTTCQPALPPGCETECSPNPNVQLCTFDTGPDSSVIATFDCPSGLTGKNFSCPDPGAHSIKFTVGMASPGLSITVTSTKVTGDGRCDTGIPDGPDPELGISLPSIDCRFVRFFGHPAYNNEPPVGPPNLNTKVPFCYPYALFVLQPACVVYSVSGPPPGPLYSGGVQIKIAWNNVVDTPRGYFHRPRMFDDPDDDHDAVNANCPAIDLGNDNVFPYESEPGDFQPEDKQFVCDITTFFDPRPNTVGTDPTSGGGGKSFNDFVIAWRFCKAKQDGDDGDGHEGDDGHGHECDRR